MERHEIFSKVWEHFVTNKGHISNDGYGIPKYRDINGNRSAIGILIPDDIYKPAMENLKLETLLHRWPELEKYLITGTYTDLLEQVFTFQLLESLQEWHDAAVRYGVHYVWDKRNPFYVQLLEIGDYYTRC